MKNISLLVAIALITLAGNRALHAQNSDANVLSYYAMGNSLDGQPMVDMQNVLRFYPVFAFREYIDSVLVTIYYGPHIYTRKSDRYDEGRYWQVQLPQFRIGEAIQRIDVETWVDLKQVPAYKRYADQLKSVDGSIVNARNALDQLPGLVNARIGSDAGKTIEQLWITHQPAIEGEVGNQLAEFYEKSRTILESTVRNRVIPASDGVRRILLTSQSSPDDAAFGPYRVAVQTDAASASGMLGSLPQDAVNDLVSRAAATTDPDVSNTVTQLALLHKKILENSGQMYFSYLNTIKADILADLAKEVNGALIQYTTILDSLRDRLASTHGELTDTSLAGPGVRRGDVIIDPKTLVARILYRNYKPGLRSLPALDPAERLGVFRARYIPFVVRNRQLETPFTATDGAVFEVGLGFSDVALSGDDFIRPELSIQRLGVAFAVTRELFSDSAAIRALVLTYDFNAYGSIGVGANFPGLRSMESYFSFGINRQAFEALLGALSKLFGPES